MNCHDTIIHVLATIEHREETLLTIGQLSRECFLSASHLQKLFRLTTGQSLIAYVRLCTYFGRLRQDIAFLANSSLRKSTPPSMMGNSAK